MGDITSTKFWLDIWRGETAHKESFPDLYRLAQNNEATVAEHLQVRDGSIHWELNSSQAIQDWKLESLSIFLDLLYSSKVDGVGMDKLCWRPSTHNEFKVRLYYRVLVPSEAKEHPVLPTSLFQDTLLSMYTFIRNVDDLLVIFTYK